MKDYKGKTLLIIGGSADALGIINIAKGLGLRVVVSDGDAGAPAFKEADEVIIADIGNIVVSAEKALASSKEHKIDGVMSAGADIPYTVSYVAKSLGLPSIGVESAKYVMDKLLMKGLFKDAGVPTARFSTVNSFDHLERILPEITTLVMIKPTDSSGGKGVVRLLDNVDRIWAYEVAIEASPSRTCMIEEWIEGPRLSLTTILTREGIATPVFSEGNYARLDEFSPYVIDDGADMPADISAEELVEIEALIKAAADSLSISEGILKAEIVLGPDGPLISDITSGLSGPVYACDTGAAQNSVNIALAAIDFALGFDVDVDQYRASFDNYRCQRFIFPKPGIVKEITVAERLKGDKSILSLDISVKEGDEIIDADSSPYRAGSVIARGESAKEAREAAIKAIDAIKIVIERTIK